MYEAVDAKDADVIEPANDPENDPVATISYEPDPFNASYMLVICDD